MIKGIESIIIFSDHPKSLADFYSQKIGLNCTIEAEVGEGEDLFGFEFSGTSDLYIVHHSKIKGKSKEPERLIFNIEVDEIEAEVKRLEEAGVRKVRDIYHVENYGLIATFEDPDGNYFQLVKVSE